MKTKVTADQFLEIVRTRWPKYVWLKETIVRQGNGLFSINASNVTVIKDVGINMTLSKKAIKKATTWCLGTVGASNMPDRKDRGILNLDPLYLHSVESIEYTEDWELSTNYDGYPTWKAARAVYDLVTEGLSFGNDTPADVIYFWHKKRNKLREQGLNC